MKKSSLQKSNWEGNGWASVEIDSCEPGDFLIVLIQLCQSFCVPIPAVIDTLDGYATDLVIEGVVVKILMDQWTFSIAAELEVIRDQIYLALEKIDL